MLDVVIHYRRGAFDLEVAFCAPTPGVIALFGRSGAGKSTVINLLAGLLTLRDGHIVLDNEPLADTARDIQLPAEQRGVACSRTGDCSLHLDVANNLRYGCAARSVPCARSTTRSLNFSGSASPRRGDLYQLSGGATARVALGRALLAIAAHAAGCRTGVARLGTARRTVALSWNGCVMKRAFLSCMYHTSLKKLFDWRTAGGRARSRARRRGRRSDNRRTLILRCAPLLAPELLGAILRGQVARVDLEAGLAFVAIGAQQLAIENDGLARATPCACSWKKWRRSVCLRPPSLPDSACGGPAGWISALQADGERACWSR
ncbi:MAG: ATP-binding cassette domain-containing protein [Steroidobacteraceae bacterium]